MQRANALKTNRYIETTSIRSSLFRLFLYEFTAMMILFLTVLFHPHPAFNQNIYINFKDGSHQQMVLTDILKIIFSGRFDADF